MACTRIICTWRKSTEASKIEEYSLAHGTNTGSLRLSVCVSLSRAYKRILNKLNYMEQTQKIFIYLFVFGLSRVYKEGYSNLNSTEAKSRENLLMGVLLLEKLIRICYTNYYTCHQLTKSTYHQNKRELLKVLLQRKPSGLRAYFKDSKEVHRNQTHKLLIVSMIDIFHLWVSYFC